jgi:hypothetical protein
LILFPTHPCPYQVPGKKYWMLSVGILQGAMSIGLGLYIDKFQDKGEKPSREYLSLAYHQI